MVASGAEAPSVAPLPLLVVDAHLAWAERLAMLLRAAGYGVTQCHSAEALQRPDLLAGVVGVVLSLDLPGEAGGMAALGWLRTTYPGLPVLATSRRGTMRVAVAALRLGASDALELPCEKAVLLHAMATCLGTASQAAEPPAWLARLSNRERQVMDLVLTGQGNKAIAAALGISPRTVEIHRARLMQKSGARGVSDLLRMALPLRRP